MVNSTGQTVQTVLKYIRNVEKLFHVFVDMRKTAVIQLMMHHVL